jgi:hypothetical protein
MSRWLNLSVFALCTVAFLYGCGGGNTKSSADSQEGTAAGSPAVTKTCENGLNGAMDTCVAVKPTAAASDNTM